MNVRCNVGAEFYFDEEKKAVEIVTSENFSRSVRDIVCGGKFFPVQLQTRF